jgi:hypothetical protein
LLDPPFRQQALFHGLPPHHQKRPQEHALNRIRPADHDLKEIGQDVISDH